MRFFVKITIFSKNPSFFQKKNIFWKFWEILLIQLHPAAFLLPLPNLKKITLFLEKPIYIFNETKFWTFGKSFFSVAFYGNFATFRDFKKFKIRYLYFFWFFNFTVFFEKLIWSTNCLKTFPLFLNLEIRLSSVFFIKH